MIQHVFYLLSLLIGLTGIGLIDYRYRLVMWRKPLMALLALAASVIFFSIWDIAGIHLNIFYSGSQTYTLGLYLLPDYPVEEFFFLSLLTYLPMVASSWLEQRHV